MRRCALPRRPGQGLRRSFLEQPKGGVRGKGGRLEQGLQWRMAMMKKKSLRMWNQTGAACSVSFPTVRGVECLLRLSQ